MSKKCTLADTGKGARANLREFSTRQSPPSCPEDTPIPGKLEEQLGKRGADLSVYRAHNHSGLMPAMSCRLPPGTTSIRAQPRYAEIKNPCASLRLAHVILARDKTLSPLPPSLLCPPSSGQVIHQGCPEVQGPCPAAQIWLHQQEVSGNQGDGFPVAEGMLPQAQPVLSGTGEHRRDGGDDKLQGPPAARVSSTPIPRRTGGRVAWQGWGPEGRKCV